MWMKGLTALGLSGCTVDQALLRVLAESPTLTFLDLSSCRWRSETWSGPSAVGQLSHLPEPDEPILAGLWTREQMATVADLKAARRRGGVLDEAEDQRERGLEAVAFRSLRTLLLQHAQCAEACVAMLTRPTPTSYVRPLAHLDIRGVEIQLGDYSSRLRRSLPCLARLGLGLGGVEDEATEALKASYAGGLRVD